MLKWILRGLLWLLGIVSIMVWCVFILTIGLTTFVTIHQPTWMHIFGVLTLIFILTSVTILTYKDFISLFRK